MVSVISVATKSHAVEVISSLCNLPDETVFGLDIETTPTAAWKDDPKAGLDPYLSNIRLVQIYAGYDVTIVNPDSVIVTTDKCIPSKCFVFDVAETGLEVFETLWNRSLVAHNAVFELKNLIHSGVNPSKIDCTLLQANALYGTRPSLSDLSEKMFDWKMDKTLQKSDWGGSLTNEQFEYAALDAVAAHRLFHVQTKELKNKNRWSCYTLMRDAQKAIARLELAGCPFDVSKHKCLMDGWKESVDVAHSELKQRLNLNPDSPKQISDWLQNNITQDHLNTWPKTKTGQLQTDEDTLAAVSIPELAPLSRYKKLNKLLTTYGNGYKNHIHPITGRIHANFMIGGTVTGRLSCRSPNIQNVPRGAEFRSLFAPSSNRVLVVADYSQIQLRISAIVSGDEAMLKAYETGEDLHRKHRCS